MYPNEFYGYSTQELENIARWKRWRRTMLKIAFVLAFGAGFVFGLMVATWNSHAPVFPRWIGW